MFSHVSVRSRAAFVGAALLCPTAAFANGRYPAANLLAFDPVDRDHIVLAATFGLLESRDGAKTFRWSCESVLGVAGQQDLMIAITSAGATVAAKYDGVVRTSDGCTFESSPQLAGRNVGDLTLFRSAPNIVAAFYVDAKLGGGFDSQVIRSDDGGGSWLPLGPPLPTDFLPLTIDAAPSDASRIYLSGRLSSADNYASAVLRSSDGGQTFERSAIPESAEHHLAYIAAVHPSDPNRIYVRVWGPSGTTIWLSDDAGVNFRKAFTGTDQILGFAISPEGNEIAFGGPGDGIWIAASDGTNPLRRSDVRPTCLAWSDDGLFACADMKVDGFSLGRSRDGAATFDPVLTFSELCGETGCGSDAASTVTCANDWTLVGPAVGATCPADAGASDAMIDGGASTTDAAPDEPAPAAGASGCGCALRPSRRTATATGPLLIAGWAALRARRRGYLMRRIMPK